MNHHHVKEHEKLCPKMVLQAELFNIPDWDCPDTVKAPFYEGLERNEHSISPILWLGVRFLGSQA